MLLITDVNDFPSLDVPCGLTIGSFDGVHLGHKTLLHHLRNQLPSDGQLIVFTFSNHPSQLFTPQSPTPLIYSPLQKVTYLADQGVDIVFLIPFTAEFAATCFDAFLKEMKTRSGFSHLVLGSDATFGKNKEGNETNVRALAERLNFEVEYLPKFLVNGTPVSSGRIRKLIANGSFDEVKQCIGRPYSLLGRIARDEKKYYMNLPNICLPPEGTLPIELKTHFQTFHGDAEMHHAEHRINLHLASAPLSLAGADGEIIFQIPPL